LQFYFLILSIKTREVQLLHTISALKVHIVTYMRTAQNNYNIYRSTCVMPDATRQVWQNRNCQWIVHLQRDRTTTGSHDTCT